MTHVRRAVPVLYKEGRPYLDLMALEVFMRDYAAQLRTLDFEEQATTVELLIETMTRAYKGGDTRLGASPRP